MKLENQKLSTGHQEALWVSDPHLSHGRRSDHFPVRLLRLLLDVVVIIVQVLRTRREVKVWVCVSSVKPIKQYHFNLFLHLRRDRVIASFLFRGEAVIIVLPVGLHVRGAVCFQKQVRLCQGTAPSQNNPHLYIFNFTESSQSQLPSHIHLARLMANASVVSSCLMPRLVQSVCYKSKLITSTELMIGFYICCSCK